MNGSGRRTDVDRDVKKDVNRPEERTRVNGEERIRGDERRSGARVDERGEVSHATSVFRTVMKCMKAWRFIAGSEIAATCISAWERIHAIGG